MTTTAERGARLAQSALPILRSPIVLWGAFVVVHLWLGLLNLLGPGLPLGDVSLVYKFWTDQAIDANYWVGIDSGWVYPIVAFVPMLAARAFGPELFLSTWLSITMILDAVALAVIIGWGRDRRNIVVGWWWLAFLVLLGPIALGRIDTITIPLAVVGVLLLSSRPQVATFLLTIAVWIKVWPAAIIGAIIIASKERAHVFAAALFASLGVIAIAVVLGSGLNVFSFITEQTARGLQVEAPISTPWMWQAFAHVPGTFVYYDGAILTWQVKGAGVAAVSWLMTPLLLLVTLTVAALGLRALRNRVTVTELLPTLSLAFVAALIAFNKVGSPQYMTWLAVPVILGLVTRAAGLGRSFRTPAILVLVLAALTQLIYPYLYGYLLGLYGPMLLVLTARNILVFVLLGWAMLVLWKLSRASTQATPGDGAELQRSTWPLVTN